MTTVINAKEILDIAAKNGISYRTIRQRGGPDISTLSRIATGKTKTIRPATLFRIIQAINQ